MPDRGNVITGLECCINDGDAETVCPTCPYLDKHPFECATQLMMDALAIIREKEKTKVVFRQYDGSVESECGNCGLYLDKTYSVCPKCGKELDWNA